AIVAELERYDAALYEKPRWLVLNKLDLVPQEEREARVKAFVDAYRWKGPVFAIAAVNGEGCRELVFKVQAWLDAHPAPDRALEASGDEALVPGVDDATLDSRVVRRGGK